jgi:hypothetical protein
MGFFDPRSLVGSKKTSGLTDDNGKRQYQIIAAVEEAPNSGGRGGNITRLGN